MLPALAACAGVLGLRDIDEATDTARMDDAAPEADDSEASAIGADAAADAGADVAVDAHRPGSCDRYPTALLCDDFEGTDAAASPQWRMEFQGGDGHVTSRPNGSDAGPYPNLQDFTVGFPMIPDVGKAALAFDGLPGGRRSLRFSLWIPEDSYPDHLRVGGVIDATNVGVEVVLDPLPGAGLGREIIVRDNRGDAGAPLDLGGIPFKTWTCIEIEINGTALRAWQKKTLFTGTVSAQTATSATTAEVGLTWTFGGGPDSLGMHYDDVVIATGAVGCD
jgi:hypothetical protein